MKSNTTQSIYIANLGEVVHTHTDTCTHTHTHTHTHTDTHVHTDTHAHSQTHTHAQRRMKTHTHARARTHMHAGIRPRARTHTHCVCTILMSYSSRFSLWTFISLTYGHILNIMPNEFMNSLCEPLCIYLVLCMLISQV